MSTLKIAAVQTFIQWKDKNHNLEVLTHLVEPLKNMDLIILPETFATGFAVDSQDCSEPSEGGIVLSWMKKIAKTHSSVICGSVLVKDVDKNVNRFYWVTPSGDVEFYDKRHLFRMAGEDAYIQPGEQKKIVSLNNFRIMLNVCYDLRFPVWSRNQQDYDLLINVANWPVPRRNAWDTLLKARAIENQAYVVGVNRIGEDGNGVGHSGGTTVIDYLGSPVVSANDNETSVITTEIDLKPLQQFKEKFPFYLDADSFRLV